MHELLTSQFWLGLLAITWVNIILSGDNAVVIALAARSLPEKQQKLAIFWGAAAAVVLRIILTIVAVELLKLPYLKLIGGLLLFWIAVKLLVPEDDGEDVASSSHLIGAIKTILIADLVMSLDNVIAVAAVAKGSLVLLALSLVISVPLVVYGATILMKLMERYPVIITVGAALIGYVAGEMLVTDPVVTAWFEQNAHWMVDFELLTVFGYTFELSGAGLLGAVLAVAAGKWIAGRKRPAPGGEQA